MLQWTKWTLHLSGNRRSTRDLLAARDCYFLIPQRVGTCIYFSGQVAKNKLGRWTLKRTSGLYDWQRESTWATALFLSLLLPAGIVVLSTCTVVCIGRSKHHLAHPWYLYQQPTLLHLSETSSLSSFQISLNKKLPQHTSRTNTGYKQISQVLPSREPTYPP